MSFNMISIFSNRKWFYWLIPIAMMMLMIAGCASDEEDGGTTITTPSTSSATTLLSGTVQTSTATSSSIDVLSSYSADHVSYAEVGSSCTVQALDSSTEKVIATTTSDSSGGYSFTDAQISANKTYKILTTCANKKMSTYVSTGKTVVVQNVSPATTAIAAFVKKALVKAVDSALSSLTGASQALKDTIKNAVLDMMDSIVTAVTENIEVMVENGSITLPEEIAQADTLEDAADDFILDDMGDASDDFSYDDMDASMDAAETQVASDDSDYYVPPTLDTELEGAAAQGTANAKCDPSRTEFGDTTEDRINACAQSIAEFFIKSLKWGVYFQTVDASGDSANMFGSKNCALRATSDSSTDGFPFESTSVKAQVDPDDAAVCFIKSTVKGTSRNSDGRSEEDDDMGIGEDTFQSFASAMINGYRYTMENINNMVFTTSTTNGNIAGWNARILATDAEGSTYVYDDSDGFAALGLDEGQLWGYGGGSRSQYDNLRNLAGTPDWEDPTGKEFTQGTGEFQEVVDLIVGSEQGNIFYAISAGSVPTKQELETFIDTERTWGEHNPTGQAEYEVLINEARRYGPVEGENVAGEPNGEFTENPCEDDNPNTECVDADGNSYSTKAIKVKLSFSTINDPSGDNNGYRYISDIGVVGLDNKKNFYLRPVYTQRGATGAFSLFNVASGKELRSPRGQEVVIAFVREAEQCDDASDDWGNFSCTSADVTANKIVELWTEWEEDPSTDAWEPTFSPPRTAVNANLITPAAGVVTNIERSKQRYFEEDHESNEEYNYCSKDPYGTGNTDLCANGEGLWDRIRMHPLASREFEDGGGGESSFSPVKFDASGDLDASGDYFAQSMWGCTDDNDWSSCSMTGFYLYKVTSNYIQLCNPSDATSDTWFRDSTDDAVSACGISEDNMDTKLSGSSDESVKRAVQKHFHSAMVANAGHDKLRDPWGLVDANGDVLTFGEQWAIAEYAIRGFWEPSGASKTNRCSYLKATADSSGDQTEADCLASEGGNNIDWQSAQNWFDWSDSRVIRRESEYRFGDAEGTKKMMSFAFPDSFFDGTGTITETSTFNALQAFAYIFFYFEGNANPTEATGFTAWGEIADTTNNRDWTTFRNMSPVFMGEGGDMWLYMRNAVESMRQQ